MKRSIMSGICYDLEVEAVMGLSEALGWNKTETISYLIRRGLKAIEGIDIKEVKDDLIQLLAEAGVNEYKKTPAFEEEVKKGIAAKEKEHVRLPEKP